MTTAEPRALNIDDAWNSVALEERLELISRANAEGILAGLGCIIILGATGYGFNEIWFLWGGIIGSALVIPLFAGYYWRKNKPAVILSYLAVRSVARRYAFSANIIDYDIVLIFRGKMKELFASQEEALLSQQGKAIELDSSVEMVKPVWICLMRGGFVFLSESVGGAKLEFISPITPDVVCRKAAPSDNLPEHALIISGMGQAKGRTISLFGPYPAALYVFEKKLLDLVKESEKWR